MSQPIRVPVAKVPQGAHQAGLEVRLRHDTGGEEAGLDAEATPHPALRAAAKKPVVGEHLPPQEGHATAGRGNLALAGMQT